MGGLFFACGRVYVCVDERVAGVKDGTAKGVEFTRVHCYYAITGALRRLLNSV